MFDTLVLGQFLSDFVRVKLNVSPRLSTSTYPREIFDRTTPLKEMEHAKDAIHQVKKNDFSIIWYLIGKNEVGQK